MAEVRRFSSHWYKSLDTEDLVELFDFVKDKEELANDEIEREFWKIKLQTIQNELSLRHVRQDQIEL